MRIERMFAELEEKFARELRQMFSCDDIDYFQGAKWDLKLSILAENRMGGNEVILEYPMPEEAIKEVSFEEFTSFASKKNEIF